MQDSAKEIDIAMVRGHYSRIIMCSDIITAEINPPAKTSLSAHSRRPRWIELKYHFNIRKVAEQLCWSSFKNGPGTQVGWYTVPRLYQPQTLLNGYAKWFPLVLIFRRKVTLKIAKAVDVENIFKYPGQGMVVRFIYVLC